MQATTLSTAARYLWAAPCSAVGLAFGTVVLLLGGKAERVLGALEFTFRGSATSCGKLARSLPFRAITFGHIIVAVTEEDLTRTRSHELVHVRQYERWGMAFFVAYPAASLWEMLNGRNAYWDNYFEVQARALSCEPTPTHLPIESRS